MLWSSSIGQFKFVDLFSRFSFKFYNSNLRLLGKCDFLSCNTSRFATTAVVTVFL